MSDLIEHERSGKRSPLPLLLPLSAKAHPDTVLSFLQWIGLNNISPSTGYRVIKRNEIEVTQLSAKRIGITLRANAAWQASRARKPERKPERAAKPKPRYLSPNANLPLSHPDRILLFPEWCELNRISVRTGRRILSSGSGPVVARLAPMRLGITVRANTDWRVEWVKKLAKSK